jgi:uncharacterized membrane-anchored protein YitT (DUF2179 family)
MPNPRGHIEEGYTYVRGHIRRTRTSGRRRDETALLGALFILAVIGLVIWAIIWFLKTFWIYVCIIGGIAIVTFVIIKWKKWRLMSILLGISGLIVCLNIFFLAKEPSTMLVNAIQVDKLSGSLGAFGGGRQPFK